MVCTSHRMQNSIVPYFLYLSNQNSVEPKNMAIPGYGGFVPGIKAENIHAKGFANMTKQSFNNEKLGKNVYGLATTGFNVTKEVFVDNSKLASSSKYGKSALQSPHPNWSVNIKFILEYLMVYNHSISIQKSKPSIKSNLQTNR